uniref:Terpene synthase metal-binding domain-containing protein n=1 Tax=Brassica oleracea var. oleracea TaxID=109376 RepID=A0A0D3CFQ5_BRAOL
MDEQKDYLKFVVKFIFDSFQEFEREICSEAGGSYSLNTTIKSCKTLVRANLQLAKWAASYHIPSFDEYLDVAGIQIAAYFTLACILMAMENICKKEAYKLLESRDQLVRLSCTKMRVMNDIYGLEMVNSTIPQGPKNRRSGPHEAEHRLDVAA